MCYSGNLIKAVEKHILIYSFVSNRIALYSGIQKLQLCNEEENQLGMVAAILVNLTIDKPNSEKLQDYVTRADAAGHAQCIRAHYHLATPVSTYATHDFIGCSPLLLQ